MRISDVAEVAGRPPRQRAGGSADGGVGRASSHFCLTSEKIADFFHERETGLAQSRRQIVDLTNQFEQPFEREEKLAVATRRQQEIVAALDITENQASSRVGQDTAQQECEALEAEQNQMVCEMRPISQRH